jgi:ABC-type transport system involved in multi-copper enzyme maturation permease subunit
MSRGVIRSWLERAGDRINPILVKETRQALKSRQFSATFMLLLAASLLVSFGGIALAGPDLDYRAAGPSFFVGYFAVLAFAIFAVVPFGAYRSLAGEQEERTFELLAITALRPGQIVAGKLLTAMIQMLIFYSALAPFMAFTYLLKGIDLASIAMVLFYALAGSVGLAMIALFLATFSSRKSWQVMLSVVLIAGLLVVTIVSIPAAFMLTTESVGATLAQPDFWIAMGILATMYVTYFALLFQLSVAQLTFEADNRSSRVRFVLVLQFLAFVVWSGYAWVVHSSGEPEILVGLLVFAALHWGVAAAFLVSEPAGLSQRVARSVPRGAAARALTALVFPGPGTGLAFLLVHLLALVALTALADFTAPWLVLNAGPRLGSKPLTLFAAVLAAYLFFYAGLGAVVVRAIRRFRPLPAIGGAAITVILAMACILVPTFFALVLPYHQYDDYRIWQISDPIATLREIYKGSAATLATFPAGLAAIVFVLNLRPMARAVAEIERAGTPRQSAAGTGIASAETRGLAAEAAAQA